MKKTSFLSVFALLGIISLVVWGCGGWFAHKNDKQQQAQTDTAGLLAKADSLLAQNLPIDSFILSKRKEGNAMIILLDTTKCGLLPEPSMDNLLTHPTYRAIFELGSGMEITTIKGEIDPFELAYKGIRYEGSNFTFRPLIINNCLVRLHRDYFVPQHEPSDIKLSRIEALEIALKQEYPTRAQYFKAKYGKYADRVPIQRKYLLIEEPVDSVAFKKKFRPNAKFSWQRLDPEQYLADSLSQYSQGELSYRYIGGANADLFYKFAIHSIHGAWLVLVNAITGEVEKSWLDN